MNYIINLDSRKDRWEKMKEQTDSLNLKVERFSAICPSWTDISQYIRKMEYNFLKKTLEGHMCYSLGATGVFESQLELWRRCIEYNKPILIFEDDITFKTKSFQKDLELLLEELENDFDMIVFFPNMEVTNIKKLNKYSILLKNPIFGAYGYYLHPDFAKKTIPFLKTMDKPFDIQVKNLYYDKPHKIYLARNYLIDTPIAFSRDSNIIQKHRNLHFDNIHTVLHVSNSIPKNYLGPFIFSKYKMRFSTISIFTKNPCRSIKMYYNNEIIFFLKHFKTHSKLDSIIHLEEKQFKIIFIQD